MILIKILGTIFVYVCRNKTMDMKKVMIFGLLSVLLMTGITSCKQKISYTKDLQTRYKFTDAELGKLQFYLEGDVVLYAASKDGNTTLHEGDILVNEAQSVDKIIFRTGTRGVFEKLVGTDKIAIRFEEGEDRFLVFGATSPKARYTLQAQEWQDNGRGVIKYGDKQYLTSKNSAASYLIVKVKKSNQYDSSQRVVKGKKLK